MEKIDAQRLLLEEKERQLDAEKRNIEIRIKEAVSESAGKLVRVALFNNYIPLCLYHD